MTKHAVVLPKKLMEPQLAVRMLRTLGGGQFKKATLWEIAALIEQLAQQAGLTTASGEDTERPWGGAAR